MVDRMSERAKVDLDRVMQQLYDISPEVDKLATDCAHALQSNVEADGDYISKRTVKAFTDIREGIAQIVSHEMV
ncbi:hypothetical protein [Rhizobium sp. 2MFCol3.1]|uniref:hypothetical protein n=1 Tax=unclassified Rhizobium TaxID=2613769 RepID=UPI0003744493|nr:hypothetical protein [Rhizobium sp. 2MFCol3.1]